jgi:hypothetical protein
MQRPQQTLNSVPLTIPDAKRASEMTQGMRASHAFPLQRAVMAMCAHAFHTIASDAIEQQSPAISVVRCE